MKRKRILGRGLRALLQRDFKSDASPGGGESEESEKGLQKDVKKSKGRGRQHALKTYKNILKKCVTEKGVGEMYEEILRDLRDHFNISEEEHQRMLKSVLGHVIPAPPAGEGDKGVIIVERGEVEAEEERTSDKTVKEEDVAQEVPGKTGEEDVTEMITGGEGEFESVEEEFTEIESGELPSGDIGESKGIGKTIGKDETLDNTEQVEELHPTQEEEELVVINTEEIIEEVERLLEDGEERRALSVLNEVLAKSEHSDLYNELGIILYRMGEYTAAESAFEKAVELGEEDYTPIINLAMLQAEMGKFDEALQNMRTALRMDPTNELILNNLAYICGSMGLYQEALDYLDELLQLNPRNVEGWFNQGVIYEKLKKFEKAYMAFDRVLSLDPSNKAAKKAREELFNKLR